MRLIVLSLLTALFCITSPMVGDTIASALHPPTSQQLSSTSSNATSLDQQAQSLFANRRFTEAIPLFQRAAALYQASGNTVQQALSLANLALTYRQVGQWQEANEAIATSLNLLKPESSNAHALAQVLDIQGNLLLAQGQAEEALRTWERAAAIHDRQGSTQRATITRLNQSQALQNLGLYRRSLTLLNEILGLPQQPTIAELQSALQDLTASTQTVTALQSLGTALRMTGNSDSARAVLQRSLALAQNLQGNEAIALSHFLLGNLSRTQEQPEEAIAQYQQASRNASPSLKVQAIANLLNLLVERQRSIEAQTLWEQLQPQLALLPPDRTSIEVQINLAQTLLQWDASKQPAAAQLLASAVRQAEMLGDARLRVDALGSLGRAYQLRQQWTDAQQVTERAVQLAQQIKAPELTYRWQWQLGQVLKAQPGKNREAIAAYQGAVGNIAALRADLASASPDVQFSFRDAVDPIHRELVELLLQTNQSENLTAARKVIEALQLVELDNFFREACLNANPNEVDQVDRKAAVIYPIILEKQLAVIISIPDANAATTQTNPPRRLQYYEIDVTREQVERLVEETREDLDQGNTADLTLPLLQQLYDWIIRPGAAELASGQVETLVFVLDGVLRNIPMAALHDGQQFLVEKYSVALTPGLQLLPARSLPKTQLSALVGGLEAESPPFGALPFVKTEVETIKAEVPSRVLFDEQFTTQAFQQSVTRLPSPIVHLATHGQFSSNAEETFILTWQDKLTVNQLSSILKTAELSRGSPLELLILSACETASGDTRSALGLAGVAVRSGARSTVATLWQVNDKASATLMGEFYKQLNQARQTGVSKAEALRRAQIAILRSPEYDGNPYFWSAYVLVGNWT